MNLPSNAAAAPAGDSRYERLSETFVACRRQSLALCAGLSAEDHMVQGAAFASPPKWHLAHTTWFFSTFLLAPRALSPEVPDSWHTLFNSYYNGIGTPHARAERGILSRPPLDDVITWRTQVDHQIQALLDQGAFTDSEFGLLELGIQHEMQHQELILTDLLYSFSRNPSHPVFDPDPVAPRPPAPALSWHEFDGGLIEVGAPAEGFSFDNEHPRHRQFLEPFALAGRLVTNSEYQAFIADGGYQDPQWWLSEAWDTLRSEDWQRPLHWRDDNHVFSLQGIQRIDGNAPVSHLSGYEADAFSRWSGCRLPTEFEWEHAAQRLGVGAEPAGLSPRGSASGWFGDVWQWTQSAYAPYPGFKPDAGAVGEYNGKFMSSQWVLRGGSFATPRAQQRISYRNFFYPRDRWQFTGLRLAKTLVPA